MKSPQISSSPHGRVSYQRLPNLPRSRTRPRRPRNRRHHPRTRLPNPTPQHPMKPKLTDLTPEQKRILCAEACGWTRCACGDTEHCDVWYGPDDDAFPTIGVSPYDTSLDAMAEARKTLTEAEYHRYAVHLWNTVANKQLLGNSLFRCVDAAAIDHLDAFLLAKGLAE